MKNILILFLLCAIGAHAQVPVVYLPANETIHFISPEPIQYVDISSKNVIGDIPLKNVLRLKLKDSIAQADAIITVAGEKYIAQYHLLTGAGPTEINILPADTKPLDIAGIGFSQNQLKSISLGLFAKGTAGAVEKSKAYTIFGRLNHVYNAGDYIFLDVSYRNNTDLKYDIDNIRFRIDDKKVTKASNVQSLELQPVFKLFDQPVFRHDYRNIFVLKKVSFPGNKVLHIELTEKQVSGRVLTLTIKYQDILDADIIPSS